MPVQPAFGNAAVQDFTAADLSSHMAPVAGRGGCYVQFFYANVQVSQPDDPTVHGTWRPRLCIAKAPKGDRLTVAVRFIDEARAAREWPVEWSAFKNNQAIPTTGTPLHELPGISQSQIAMLVIHNLRCIEDVAALPQARVETMGLEVMNAHGIAKRWLKAKEEGADLIRSVQIETRDALELETLRKRDADQSRTIAEMQAKIDVLMRMAPGQAPVQNAKAIEVDGIVPVPITANSADFGGSATLVVTGNDDLSDDNPLDLPGRGRKR